MAFLFVGCSSKQPVLNTSSATILIKTPTMKFYDKGFINKFKDYTQVQVFTAGTAILDMKIYEDKVCTSTLQCQDLKTFNKESLSATYEDDFIVKLFEKNDKEIIHKDKENGILIKIKRD